MGLPSAPLARGTIEVAGETVAVRSLTRAEVLRLRDFGDAGDNRSAEVMMIAAGLDVPEEEAAAWWDASDPMAVQKLVTGIGIVSRITGGDGESDPKPAPSARSSKAG